jgi:hypothetical protein
MIPFKYELLYTAQGASAAARVQALIAGDPLLRAASQRWAGDASPANAALYALLVVVTDDLVAAGKLRQRITEIEARSFPVIPIVESVASYDFRRVPVPALASRNAVGLDEPEALLAALSQHGGLRRRDRGGHVMISYARVDGSALAEELRARLQEVGFEVFMDVHGVTAGESIQRTIKGAIDGAELVLLVDSLGAARSPWVADELDMARAAHVPVLGVTRQHERYHALRFPSVPWDATSPLEDVAEVAVTAARRLLAHKMSFRERVCRALGQLALLRGWPLEESRPDWLVTPADPGVRVGCIDEAPRLGDVTRFKKRLASARGLLIAGTRPLPPDEVGELRDLGGDVVRVAPLGQVASALADRAAGGCLKGKRVFLSAAMPDDAASEVAAHTLAPFVITFIQTMFSLGATIVFGGHPSITGMIHKALLDIAAADSGTVELHQAKRWLRELPPEAKDRRIFGEIKWHGAGAAIASDIEALRAGMIVAGLDAAVFVGGKVEESLTTPPGIVVEYRRFREVNARRPVFLLGLADGASAALIEAGEPKEDVVDPLIASELATTRDPDMATALIVAELCGALGSGEPSR